MNKTCPTCKNDKPVEEFNWKNKAKGTRQHQCRDCHKAYKRSYYSLNKEKIIPLRVAYNKSIVDELYELKKTLECSKCGENHPACLDFHHIDPTTKLFSVSQCYGVSRRQLKAEIAKCVVLCANCHRKHHAGVVQIDVQQPSKLTRSERYGSSAPNR